MIIQQDSVGGVPVFRLKGDFIGEPDQTAFQQLVRERVKTGLQRLVVDLSEVRYINSCGIGSLVGALTTLRRAGGEIYLAGANREILSVFETAQLQLIFHFHSDVDHAVGAVGRATA